MAENSYSTSSKSYKTFMACLLRQKSKYSSPSSLSPGKLTSFYLDCFLLRNKQLCAASAIDAGLCQEGAFTAWRKEQKRLGNLDWETVSMGGDKIRYDYRPGVKIQKHLSAVASENFLYATKGDLGDLNVKINEKIDSEIDSLRKELNTVRSDVSEMRTAMQGIIATLDDPYTDEKLEDYKKNPDKFLRLVMTRPSH